ncbi:MAG: acyl carrier protein [Lachnospiraceae bacterium]|jgi:acyl carrier protein|nr:acyl carrier protein [Lachnospiraceae bacterium]
MDRLLEILRDIDETVDYENEKHLIDDHLLDSFGIITLISEIEDAFDIEVEAAEMTPENFNSAEAMWAMICRLQES